MLVESSGIVLRTQRFGDTSLVATVYTQQFGICTVLAKGARATGSARGNVLEVPNHIRLAFYRSPRRQLFLLRAAELLERFPRLRDSLEHTVVTFVVAESLLLTQQPDEPNAALYGLLLQALRSIEQAEKAPFGVAIAFLLRLARIAGFAPRLEPSAVKEQQNHYVVRREDGALEPAHGVHAASVVLSAEEAVLLQRLQQLPLEAAAALPLTPESARRLTESLLQFLEYHLERPLRLRSMALWDLCPTTAPAA